MGFFSSISKAVSNIGKTVKQSIEDIPGSVKGFVNNPLQSVEKGLGQTVNAASLGTIGKIGGGKLVKDVGAGVLTAGTGALVYNAVKPSPKAAPKVAPTPTPVPPVPSAPVSAPVPLPTPPVDVSKQVLSTLGQIKNITGGSKPPAQASPQVVPLFNGGGPVASSNGGNTPVYIVGGVAVLGVLFALMRK